MRKIAILCGAILLAANTAWSESQSNEDSYFGFKKAAEQINKTLPKMIGSNTRADRATAGPGAAMSFYYTITDTNALDISSMELQSTLYPELRGALCNDQLQKKALQHGAIYSYIYSGKDGLVITRITIDRTSCGYELLR